MTAPTLFALAAKHRKWWPEGLVYTTGRYGTYFYFEEHEDVPVSIKRVERLLRDAFTEAVENEAETIAFSQAFNNAGPVYILQVIAPNKKINGTFTAPTKLEALCAILDNLEKETA